MFDRRLWLHVRSVALAGAIGCAACGAALQRPTTGGPAHVDAAASAVAAGTAQPARVGVAFGGGSARGIAHIGVIRWLEEHRIPIDVAAGTSMGGLIGGAFATGMDAADLQSFITSIDWDALFGSSSFPYRNVRRKADGRAYPSRLEFGLKGGIVPPTALNSGESVEWLLARIAAPYFEITTFDELPTPFRAVAVDLLSAQPVVLRSGSLADAMRATMSLPLIFPPMDADGRLLVDGGAMNNVPADVVRAMGAQQVVAINVGDLSDREGVDATMFGLASETMDAMMRASTRRALTSADVVINVPLENYGSLDWRRAVSLIDEGYRAAEAMRDQLLPLAVTEVDFERWRANRKARRRTALPAPAFVELDGFAASDARRLGALLERHVGTPLTVEAIERDIAPTSGLDRYQSVTWLLTRDPARGTGLRVRGRLKSYAPPFLMLGGLLENTTSSDFRVAATVRYLGFDQLGSGSELRLDATVGTNPSAAIELYRPIGSTPLFVAPYAGVVTDTFNLISQDAVVARYSRTIPRLGASVGLNIGARSDVRIGAYVGHTSASVETGDPGFPEVRGKETGADLVWRVDTQDSPSVPSSGLHSHVRLSHVFDGPELPDELADRFETTLTQLEGGASQFWSSGPRNRLFVYGALGTSFYSTPLPPDQFALGTPFRLGAYATGEIRGAHSYIVTGGYLRRIARLPDFIGGPVFAGAWVENGDAFDSWRDATWRSHGGSGLVMDTLLGPVVLAASWSFDGRWRTYLAVGRTFK